MSIFIWGPLKWRGLYQPSDYISLMGSFPIKTINMFCSRCLKLCVKQAQATHCAVATSATLTENPCVHSIFASQQRWLWVINMVSSVSVARSSTSGQICRARFEATAVLQFQLRSSPMTPTGLLHSLRGPITCFLNKPKTNVPRNVRQNTTRMDMMRL